MSPKSEQSLAEVNQPPAGPRPRAGAGASPSTPPPPAPRIFGPEHRALTIGILAVVSLVAFEAMAVATAMPVAVKDLGGLRLYALAFSAFLTTSLVGMVMAGEVSDRRGPLVPFLAAIAIFGVGLVLAGLATSMWVFIVARAIQGFGGGMNIVALYVVAGRAYEPSMRPRLFSVMSTAWVVPAIVGPFLSGVVADEISWRWVFLAVPPLVVPAVLLMLPRLLRLPTVAPETAVTRRTGLAIGTALGMALLQYAGQRLDLVSVALVAVAFALLVPTVPKLLPRGTLLAAGALPTAILLRGVLAGSFFGAETFVPLMLIEERGLATSVAGLTLTGAALSWSVGSWLQGRPSNRIARHRLIQWGAGLVGVAVATVSLTLWHALPPGVAAVSWAIGGLGMGLAMSSVNVVMLDLSPASEQGFNSAALQVSDALGSIVFIGSAGAVFSQLHDGGASSVTPFLIIFGMFAMIAFIGAWLAPRVARRS